MQPLKELEIGKQHRNKCKDWSLPVLGFDTETLTNGDIFLIADSDGKYIWRPTFLDCLRFLFTKTHHQKLNFFWNLNFDVSGVVKFLSTDYLTKLMVYREIKLSFGKYGVFTLKYMQDKMFVIKPKRRVSFYDLAQFFDYQALDKAGKSYVGDKKSDMPDYDFTLETIEKRKQKIIDYCIQDCTLVAKLGEISKRQYERLGIFEKKYISPAFLTEKHFNTTCYIPKTVDLIKQDWGKKPSPVEYGLLSYAGGWIDILFRGSLKKVYRYDINSAYPWAMCGLIDPNVGEWVYSKKWLPGSIYAFVKCRVYIDHRLTTPSPISFVHRAKSSDVRCYPTGEWITYLTHYEYSLINEYLGEAEVIDGWFYFPGDMPTYGPPLNTRIRLLFEKKKLLKEEAKTDPKAAVEYHNIKLLLNSLYGKFIQRSEIKDIDKDGNIFVDHYKTGNFFNPMWAALITAKVRVKLAEAMIDKAGSLAVVTTDGLITTEPLDLDFGDGLGQWAEEPGGEAVIVLAGAYGIRGQKMTNRIRGFAGLFKDPKVKDWFDYLSQHRDEPCITVTDRRPVSIMEVLLQLKKFTAADINRFEEFTRTYDLKEWRRHWDREVKSCGDLLDRCFYSDPWRVEDFIK